MVIDFDPKDPFPAVPQDQNTYAYEQQHAKEADEWLGFHIKEIEDEITERNPDAAKRARLSGNEERWVGLAPETLQTPYVEFRAILDLLKPKAGQTVVDLGAAYGRLGFVIARHYPGVKFVGYELLPERVLEGRRVLAAHGSADTLLLKADLSLPDFKPAQADFYFIYDFGSRGAIDKVLVDLKEISCTRAITVVGRGRAIRDAIEREQPWLSAVVKPIHYARFSIYQSRELS